MTPEELKSLITELCFCGGRIRFVDREGYPFPVCENGCSANDIFQEALERNKTLLDKLQRFDGKLLTTNVVREVLRLYRIKMAKNEITNEVELSGIPKEWSAENAENHLPVYLNDMLMNVGVKRSNKSSVADALDLIADENRYNPVRDYLTGMEWDEHDRFPTLFEILGVTDPFRQTLVRKWMRQTAALGMNSGKEPFGADGVLVLQGEQGIGKTSFFRKLAPSPALFKEGAEIDPMNKDTIIEATGVWICELGELERTTRKEQASLKAFITSAVDQFRSPYARKAVRRPRRTSFCGTVNQGSFLVDDTGNRRFWTVPVAKIDLERLFELPEYFIRQLWIEAALDEKDDPQGFRLTGAERAFLQSENQAFERPLPFELEVRALLDFDLLPAEWRWVSPVEISKAMSGIYRPQASDVGKILAKIMLEDGRVDKKKSNGIYYFLPYKAHLFR